MRHLFTKEFVWIVANDDNRAADGIDLRHEFLNETLNMKEPSWMQIGCSVLEMLIALSRRLAFETEREPRGWFWHLIETLDLHIYTDEAGAPAETVSDILDKMIWRNYHPDGSGGGLFPLESSHDDQRGVEIWYQLSAYLVEMMERGEV